MSELRRIVYDNPPIVSAVMQVRLSWNQAEMLQAMERFQGEAQEFFQSIEPTFVNEIQVHARPDGVSQRRTSSPSGLKCIVSDAVTINLEPTGLRSIHVGEYQGRESLIEGLMWWIERLASLEHAPQAVRVSSLVENRIVPPIQPGETYRIEHYIVPRFEFVDERMQLFPKFSHNIELDLSEMAQLPTRGKVTINVSPETEGLLISIDVLIDDECPLDQVEDRMRHVKNIETHVFEECITDTTRNLYGPNT